MQADSPITISLTFGEDLNRESLLSYSVSTSSLNEEIIAWKQSSFFDEMPLSYYNKNNPKKIPAKLNSYELSLEEPKIQEVYKESSINNSFSEKEDKELSLKGSFIGNKNSDKANSPKSVSSKKSSEISESLKKSNKQHLSSESEEALEDNKSEKHKKLIKEENHIKKEETEKKEILLAEESLKHSDSADYESEKEIIKIEAPNEIISESNNESFVEKQHIENNSYPMLYPEKQNIVFEEESLEFKQHNLEEKKELDSNEENIYSENNSLSEPKVDETNEATVGLEEVLNKEENEGNALEEENEAPLEPKVSFFLHFSVYEGREAEAEEYFLDGLLHRTEDLSPLQSAVRDPEEDELRFSIKRFPGLVVVRYTLVEGLEGKEKEVFEQFLTTLDKASVAGELKGFLSHKQNNRTNVKVDYSTFTFKHLKSNLFSVISFLNAYCEENVINQNLTSFGSKCKKIALKFKFKAWREINKYMDNVKKENGSEKEKQVKEFNYVNKGLFRTNVQVFAFYENKFAVKLDAKYHGEDVLVRLIKVYWKAVKRIVD